MVGLVTEKAAAISPAGTSRSQMRARISRRTGEVSAPITLWMSRTASLRRLQLNRQLPNLVKAESRGPHAEGDDLADCARRAQGARRRSGGYRGRRLVGDLAVQPVD